MDLTDVYANSSLLLSIVAPEEFAHLLPVNSFTERALKIAIFGVITTLGVLTNTACIVVLAKGRLYTNWTFGMILNLSVTDLLMCLNALCLFFPGAISGRFTMGNFICRLRMLLTMVPFSMTSISFMLSALHRYLAIVHNKNGLWLFSSRWQPHVLAVTWLAVFLICLPYAVGPILYQLWQDFCIVVADQVVNYAVLVGFVGLPILVVPFMYAHILIVVCRASRKVTDASSSSSKPKNRSNRTAFVLFVLYLAFVVGYGPYLVFSLSVLSVTPSPEEMKTWIILTWGAVAVVSACNPALYVLLFPQIRQALVKMLTRRNSQRTEVTQLTLAE